MDREYIIAGFRIRLEQVDRLFVRPGSHMARAFEPFAAEADPAASLTMRLIPDCTINKELTGGEPNRELDVFPFDDAEADCHFERTPRGYLFRMVPRNGDRPTLFFKAFNSPDVQSDLLADGREPHQSLMRFGLWIMFGIAISPEAIAIHSSTIECEGRAVLFLGESGTGKSTHTRLWQEHIPGARLLNDDSPIIRMYQGQATAFGSPWSGKTPCYRNISRPIAGIVRLSQAPANEITRLSILRAVGSLLPSCPPAFAYDSDLQDRICRTLSDILTQAPVWHLACLPDQTVRICVQGQSMLPFFRSGSVITLRPLRHEDLRRGAVVMAETVQGNFVVHRIIQATPEEVTLLGDGNLTTETMPPAKVYGVVDCSAIHRVLARVWLWLRPVRRYPLWVLRRICRK